MKPNPEFLNQDKSFWASVRSLSQKIGYTIRGEGINRVPSIDEMAKTLKELSLNPGTVKSSDGEATELGFLLHDYFDYRASILNDFVEPNLMDKDQARKIFNKLYNKLKPTCPLPMNKQKGDKKSHSFLTCIINMLIEKGIKNYNCDYDPRELTTVTRDGTPLRTLSRRIDGAFPSAINPVAVWEIKEYYYTTTFGSRVADGVYETLLDGMELEELREHEDIDVLHYLMVDDHFTWWDCGKSYLCRLIDALHMGYVDEIFFGREVIEELPKALKIWITRLEAKSSNPL